MKPGSSFSRAVGSIGAVAQRPTAVVTLFRRFHPQPPPEVVARHPRRSAVWAIVRFLAVHCSAPVLQELTWTGRESGQPISQPSAPLNGLVSPTKSGYFLVRVVKITPVSAGASDYGSEGWGFESLRACH